MGQECACSDAAKLSCALPAVLEAPKTPLEPTKLDAIGLPKSENASSNAGWAVMAMLLFDPLIVTPKVSPVSFPPECTTADRRCSDRR